MRSGAGQGQRCDATWGRVAFRLASTSALAFILLSSGMLLFGQGQRADRWVGTWSTAEVGRPQNPPVPAPALPPYMPNQCPPAPPPVAPAPGQTFAPLPFTHFTNQTLRQIVHTSIGGSKVRVAVGKLTLRTFCKVLQPAFLGRVASNQLNTNHLARRANRALIRSFLSLLAAIEALTLQPQDCLH